MRAILWLVSTEGKSGADVNRLFGVSEVTVPQVVNKHDFKKAT